MTRVLIVEDEIVVAMVVESSLQAAGFEVCGIAASAEEALRLGALHRPDAAVVDIRLNPGDGREVARQLHGAYGTRILFASGHATEAPPLRDYATGDHVFVLAKPYLPDEAPQALQIMADLAAGRPARHPLPRSLVLLDLPG